MAGNGGARPWVRELVTAGVGSVINGIKNGAKKLKEKIIKSPEDKVKANQEHLGKLEDWSLRRGNAEDAFKRANPTASPEQVQAYLNANPELVSPKVPISPVKIAAAATAVAAGLVTTSVLTDKDNVIGIGGRLLDSATGWAEDNLPILDKEGKPLGDQKVGIGWYRSVLMTNYIMQDKDRSASFAQKVKEGAVDPGLLAIWQRQQMQPAVDSDAQTRITFAAELAKAAPAQAAASAAAGIAEAQARELEKRRDQAVQDSYTESLDAMEAIRRKSAKPTLAPRP